MKFFIDAQLPVSLAKWLSENFEVEAISAKAIKFQSAPDLEIFNHFRKEGSVIVSKDSDFVNLVQQRGTPPQLLWIRCGNSTKLRLQKIFEKYFQNALQLFLDGADIVEITD